MRGAFRISRGAVHTDTLPRPLAFAPAGPVSLHEINTYYDRLANKPDLSSALAKHRHDSAWPPKRGERAGDFILATCEVLSGLDRWGISTQETLLMQQGESTHAKWAVDWAMLGKAMKRSLVEAIIRDKLGDKAIRCWRILEAKGKLEEKHVRLVCFLHMVLTLLTRKHLVAFTPPLLFRDFPPFSAHHCFAVARFPRLALIPLPHCPPFLSPSPAFLDYAHAPRPPAARSPRLLAGERGARDPEPPVVRRPD